MGVEELTISRTAIIKATMRPKWDSIKANKVVQSPVVSENVFSAQPRIPSMLYVNLSHGLHSVPFA